MPPKRQTLSDVDSAKQGSGYVSPNRTKRKAAPNESTTKRIKSAIGSRRLRGRDASSQDSEQRISSTRAAQKTAISQYDNHDTKEYSTASRTASSKELGSYPKAKNEPSWETFFVRLAVYKQRHNGSVCPPSSDKQGDTLQLARWVSYQRSKSGKSKLTDDQIAALDALGFSWNPREDEFNREWDKRFEELKVFAQEHGHCKVPLKHPGGLGDWVSKQRNAQQLHERMESGDLQKDIDAGKVQKPKKSRIMSQEHRDRLDSIGFVWKVYGHRGWDLKYQELMEYKEKYGNCLVPQHWLENKGLGKFVARQRYLYCMIQQGKTAKNPLTPERIAMLDAIGFHWGRVRPNTWKDPKTEEARGKAEGARSKVVPGKVSGSEESFVDIAEAV